MLLTRSSAKTENMAISEEIRNYFSDQSLDEIFSELKEEIVSKFKDKLCRELLRLNKKFTD